MIKRSILKVFLLSCFLVAVLTTSQYRVTSTNKTSNSVILTLSYFGTDDYYLKPTSPIIKELKFEFHSLAFEDFNIKISDLKNQRFEVPQEGPFPIDPLKNFSFPLNLAAFQLQYTENPFDFKVVRRFNNATLFSTYDGEFIFSDYYLQVMTEVESDYTYGLGERFNSAFKLKEGKWTVFDRDRGMVIDKGTGLQTYGYYPLYLQRQSQNLFHINYLRSSNAMDVIKQSKNGKNYLTYKVIGGIFDFRFLLGNESPQGLISRFHMFIGRSAIPPFWAFGYHQCRWGYKNVSFLENVIGNFSSNGLPLDTIWSDIDYMIDYEDFTIDQSRFPLDRMKAITDKLHYIPIIDAGIKVNGTAYTQGIKRGVFINDANGSVLQGQVWPGKTTFVDFLHPNASQYWQDMLNILYSKVKFSGVWLDMNQYANFCDGPCETPTGESKFDYSKDLPYNPTKDNVEARTIPLNTTHYQNLKQADVHAFAGMLETYATNLFLKSKNLRPFIIARSSTFGSNRYGFHWTGDNRANYDFLRSSITDNFLNQMWGFQMVGPDICGFGGSTNEQLCSRWYQLATLYPFARNHNDQNSISQQPYALGDTVLASAKANLKLRYSLLKHYYSIFVSRRGVGTIFTPMFFVFPLDKNNFVDEIAETQFLVGTSLMAAPILQEGKTSRNVYFTTMNWYNIETGEKFPPGTANIKDVQLTDRLPLFLREDSLILMQNTDDVLSTKDLDNRFHLLAAFHFDKNRSDENTKIYEAAGSHISISDYNDETKVAFCLREGCEYNFRLVLTVGLSIRTLKIDSSYGGGALLNDLLIINEVTVFYDNIKVHNSLSNPVEIHGAGEIVIPIMDEDGTHNLLRSE